MSHHTKEKAGNSLRRVASFFSITFVNPYNITLLTIPMEYFTDRMEATDRIFIYNFSDKLLPIASQLYVLISAFHLYVFISASHLDVFGTTSNRFPIVRTYGPGRSIHMH